MATFKHISSKNADYGATEQYLTFEHDEFTKKPTLDKNGQTVPRTGYLISSLNCGDDDFAIACMRSNLKYGKSYSPQTSRSHMHLVVVNHPLQNYLQVGMYTEMIFPQKNVRFIAINDGVDSAQGDNDFAPLRNIFNKWLVRDTSKKIRAVKRSKGMSGKPVTSKPVYGYLMDGDENFIIDGEAVPVVKQIYSLCLAGNGPTKIARMLTEQQIPTPGTLEYRRTGSTRRYHPGYECKWATNTVAHILENREYTGCLVNFKTEKVSYKVKQSKENPEEKQAVFENHHKPIIDRDTWEHVQELRKQRKRPNRYDEVGLFSGILFCADCDSVMYQQRYQTDKGRQDCYICGSYKKRTRDCTAHFIRTDLLTEQAEDGSKRRNAAKKKELEAAEKRIAELSAIFKRLYEDSVTGCISDERFTELSAGYEAEQKELKEKAAVLQGELSRTLEATANAEKFMKVVRKYTSFEELTPTLLREFVEKIVIHESEALDGKRRGSSADRKSKSIILLSAR